MIDNQISLGNIDLDILYDELVWIKSAIGVLAAHNGVAQRLGQLAEISGAGHLRRSWLSVRWL